MPINVPITSAGGAETTRSLPDPIITTTNPAPTGVPGSWSLRFQDEFNGTSLDSARWGACWFPQSGCGSMNNVGTNPANVSVANGNLILTLASGTSGALVSSNPNYHGSIGYQFGVGVVEARILFPGDGARLYNWPAFWTNGQSWPGNGENDVAEVLGGQMTVNYHSNSGSHNQGAVPGYWGDAFHTYTLHRKTGSSDVYYDGRLVKTYGTDDANAPQYIILNVGRDSSQPLHTGLASQVKVDYVRAWQ